MRAGIAAYPNDGLAADALFQNAEAALKKAKAGGEKYLFYTREMTDKVAERLSLENRLRTAVDKDEFVLHYQPKVELSSGRIVGVEALIRWQSAEGLVPPAKFIPILEETGLIVQAGAWALRRALRDHRAWTAQGLAAPRIAVNVSAFQLRQRNFIDVLKQALEAACAPPLDLEITESLIMEDIDGTIAKLRSVRELGLSLAIDDFGTGYSSLSYLARLPVETLKIDRSFVNTMAGDADAATLVQTIITMAHSLRLEVVAEGVETEEQAALLRRLRCGPDAGLPVQQAAPAGGAGRLARTGGRPTLG